jgi:hypothetical protein
MGGLLFVWFVSRWVLVAKVIVLIHTETPAADMLDEEALEHWKDGAVSENIASRDVYKDEH